MIVCTNDGPALAAMKTELEEALGAQRDWATKLVDACGAMSDDLCRYGLRGASARELREVRRKLRAYAATLGKGSPRLARRLARQARRRFAERDACVTYLGEVADAYAAAGSVLMTITPAIDSGDLERRTDLLHLARVLELLGQDALDRAGEEARRRMSTAPEAAAA